ncbi:MAG: GNAT family N-acetyltransferase [Firmicutes bacterium]|nr:GNAT family N-acetyltransferase [Bacillota bacterium]
MELELILPAQHHREQVEDYKRKFIAELSTISGVGIHGAGSLSDMSFDEWLTECEDHQAGRNLPEGFVPATQFIAIRKSDNKVVGTFAIRHSLTPHLERIGGHIGYSVAPDERRKGYATQMLQLGIDECKKLGIHQIRITCLKDNIASAGVIKKFNAIHDGDAEFDGKVLDRYWIV